MWKLENLLQPSQVLVIQTCSSLHTPETTWMIPSSDISVLTFGDIFVWIYWYENGVNFDSCKSVLTILDPNNFCTGNIFRVFGQVLTENSVPVEAVNMNLDGMGTVLTGKDGSYRLMPCHLQVTICWNHKERMTGLLEGVSALDVIMIQQHIQEPKIPISISRLVATDV